jgi:perosamine synthetase
MIPLFKPSVTEEEIEAVTRVLRSGWWGLGPETEAFEAEFAEFVGVRHAVAVNSATAALELAARACGITGKTVAVPALTFVSTAQAMQHAGNRVVFADIQEDDLCLDWADPHLAEADAVVPVWYAGSVYPPEGQAVGQPWPEIPIIEDCAHAAGSGGAGHVGWAACWSFQAVKNLATGDGGMVTTDDPEVAKFVRQLRWCGIDKSTWERDQGKYGWDYSIPLDGEKMHMNDIAAAIGRVQLRRLKKMNKRRDMLARIYAAQLRNLGWLDIRPPSPYDSNHLCVVRVAAKDRNRFIDHMLANGVSAGVHYKPLTHYPHLFPGKHNVPVTESVWQQLVTIPLYPDMTEAEQEQVISTVRSFPA